MKSPRLPPRRNHFEIEISEMMPQELFSLRLLSLKIMSIRFIHVIARVLSVKEILDFDYLIAVFMKMQYKVISKVKVILVFFN